MSEWSGGRVRVRREGGGEGGRGLRELDHMTRDGRREVSSTNAAPIFVKGRSYVHSKVEGQE